MNRSAACASQNHDSPAGLLSRIVAKAEEGLARLLLPAIAAVAVLLFFTMIYGMVDDLAVAAIMAVVVPMMFLPLLRHQRVS